MADVAVTSTVSGQQQHSQTGDRLARQIGFFGLLVLSISSMGLLSAGQMPFSEILGRWPGSDLVLVLSLGIVPLLFQSYTYSMIGSLAPRPGPDYFVASRVLGKPLGFVASWTMVITSALLIGAIIAKVPQTVFTTYFRTVGITRFAPSMLRISLDMAVPETVVSISTICMVVAFLSLLIPPHLTLRTMKIGFFLLLGSWAVILFVLATAGDFSFQSGWDQMMGTGSYLDHIIQAKTRGLDAQVGQTPLPIIILLISLWLYFGSYAPAYLAGEVKNPEKNLLPASLVALLASAGIFIGVSLLLLRLVPLEWLSAESFLLQSSTFEDLSMPWVLFYISVIDPNPVLGTLIFFTWLYSCINLAQAFMLYCSRVILAWVDDGLLPEIVGFVHPSLRSPILAVLIVALLGEIGIIISATGSATWNEMNYLYFILCTQVIPVLAVTLLPFLKRDLFESAPRIVRLKIGPLPVISLVGFISLLYLLAVITAGILYPTEANLSVAPGVAIGVVVVFGLIWYYVRKSYLASKPASSELLPAD